MGQQGGKAGATRVIATIGSLAVIAFSTASPSVAGASHNEDLHSPNASLIANFPSGPGGDIAFWGHTAVLSHGADDGDSANDGFWLVDIANPARPRKISEYSCVASGYDVGVWDKLVFLSVNENREGTACDAPAAPPDPGQVSDQDWAGLRVVSIADPKKPRQIAAVEAGCDKGTHTHTILPDLANARLIIYGGGLCESVIEVPLEAPAEAREIRSFALAGTNPSSCHDVTVLVAEKLAACAAITETQLWDISDPVYPQVLSRIYIPGVEHQHNTIFSSDGNTLVIGEERIDSLTSHTCFGGTPAPYGGLYFFDISNRSLPIFKANYQLPQQVDDSCTAHQFNVVPRADERDVLVAGWIRGGTTVVDFTRPDDPRQIAYYIPEPKGGDRRPNSYASYFYNGEVYANNYTLVDIVSTRGLDVFRVNDPGLTNFVRLRHLNAQTQERLP